MAKVNTLLVQKKGHSRLIAGNEQTRNAWAKDGWKPLSEKELKAKAKKAGKKLEPVKDESDNETVNG